MIKDLFKFFVAVMVLTSCGSKSDNSTVKEDYGDAATVEKKSVSLIEEGEALVKKSDCNTCHHATSKIVGPSHTEVAEKYEFTEANVKMLAERIIKGSSGTWGQVMMNPHPGLSQEDAGKMAYYVLALDGEKEPN